MKILVVCTANVCRSSMAEAFLRDRLPANALVRSCGLLASGQDEPDPRAVAAAAELGATVPSRPSRRLRHADLVQADLILGLATQHVREVVVLHRPAFPRAFTIAELVERGRAVGPPHDGEGLNEWLSRLHEGRVAADLTIAHPALDVGDPTGGETAGYRTTASRLASLADGLADLLRPFTTPSAESGRLQVIADGAAASVLHATASRRAAVSVTPVDSWAAAVQEVTRTAGPDRVVLCLTGEPHGVAMLANRAAHVRAVAVANPGAARRARRVLAANVLSVSSHIDAEALLAVLEVSSATELASGVGDRRPEPRYPRAHDLTGR